MYINNLSGVVGMGMWIKEERCCPLVYPSSGPSSTRSRKGGVNLGGRTEDRKTRKRYKCCSVDVAQLSFSPSYK
jgi:hypothetical protein